MLFLTGCNSGGDLKNSDPDDVSDPIEDTSDDASDSSSKKTEAGSIYTIIYPNAYNIEIQNLAKEIRREIKQAHGDTLKIGSDKDGAKNASEYEILLGDTNRSESYFGYEEAGNSGWWVSAEGTRIVINGGTIKGITEAVKYFLENYEYKDGKVIFDASKKKVVYAQNDLLDADITLRVGSYNVKKGIQGKNGEADDFTDANIDANIAGIAQDIKDLNLDIVGLQEIDIGTNRTGKRNIVELIANAAGYQYYEFTKAIDYDGGEYGSGIISKYKIEKFEAVILPRDPSVDSEERAVGIATIDYKGNKIKFMNTHLTVKEDEAGLEAKRAQMRKIAELVEGEYGFLLTGDFNTSDTSIRSLIPDTKLVNNGTYKTFANVSPIDDIVLESGWKVINAGMNDAVTKGHSDHNLLWAEIKYTGGK